MIRFILLVFCFYGFLSKAQNLSVIDINEMNITDDTLFLEIGSEEFDITVYAGLKNNSTSQVDVNITRTEVSVIPWTSSYFCWGSCTGVTTSGDAPIITPSGFVTFGANHQIPATEAGFTFHYDPNNQVGTSFFKVQFFDVNNIADTANLFISITSSDISGFAEIEKTQMQLFPNPCENELTHNANSTVYIYNVEGNLILTSEASTIDTSSLPSGKYILKSEEQLTRFIKAQR